MQIDFNTLIIPLSLLGAVFLMGIVSLAVLLPRLSRLRKSARRSAAALEDDGQVSYPPVSVIVSAIYNAQQLPELLQSLLTQDYPAAMEVIVVGNSENAYIEETVQRLQARFTNLYMTFVPDGSRSVSRRKLAITLGIKAARFDYVLLTQASCRIASPLWLRAMARHFAEGAEIVTGASLLRTDDESVRPSRTIAFDRERSQVQYLAAALRGKMFRADACNMGYAKRLFMAKNGFSEALSMENGDDDVFVDSLSRKKSCGVELSEASRVVCEVHSIKEEHLREKIARRFTLRHVRRGTLRLWAFLSWTWALMWLCGLGAIASVLPWGHWELTLSNWMLPIGAAVAVALLLSAACVPVMVSWRKTALTLGERPLCFTAPWLLLWHPLYTLRTRLRSRKDVHDYTWQSL
ncbi:MAG: glycosyltransferase [Muribaculaceae bacterium]|nr:glycosyltransferase [Muribaculaceae bacterium]